MHGPLLSRSDLAVDALDAASALLGCVLVHGPVAVRIVEVEAYRGAWDTGCHAKAGRTARNAPMWGPAGHAYVYLCYGIHQMLNVTTGVEGEGAAVLVRGVEAVAGHARIAARRGRSGRGSLAGPGKVAQALAVDTSFSHHDLLAPGGLELRRGRPPAGIVCGPRIGIDYAAPEHRDAPWRLADADSVQVSHRKGLS